MLISLLDSVKLKRNTLKVDIVATEYIAAGFGPSKIFLVYNGAEFDNEEYKERV